MDSKEPNHLSICHTGVALRMLLGMCLLVGLLAWFGAGNWHAWWLQFAFVLAGVLPACLLWLLAVCASQKPLQRRSISAQRLLVCSLGAVAGAYAHAMRLWLGQDLGLFAGVAGFWWTWAPAMATGALLAGVCVLWLEQRERSQQPALTQARMEALQARIRPHFLFNTLNTAIALVQSNPDRAETVLEDLAELFQLALSSPKAEVSMRQEVDLARRYIGIEQLRFEQRLQVSWHIDDDAQLAATPILLLQPLLENAVHHGVEPSLDKGWVDVRVCLQSGRVHVTVANSMAAEKSTDEITHNAGGHGLALRNLQQRLALLHDVEMQFDAGLQAANAQYPQPHFKVICAWPFRQVAA